MYCILFFFFKQKMAYEMRISDWSSDVCSSDLRRIPEAAVAAAEAGVADLPDDATFNDDDSDAHYGIAWWAIEYVAEAYGEDAPWQLLDAMGVAGARSDERRGGKECVSTCSTRLAPDR